MPSDEIGTVYRGGRPIALVEPDFRRGSVPFQCLDCGGNGIWEGHPDGEPRRCIPCSGRGYMEASL